MSALGAWSARIETVGWDILIAQTPFPYRLAVGTSLVVRYHDAIPVLHLHTLSEGESEATRHLRTFCLKTSAGVRSSLASRSQSEMICCVLLRRLKGACQSSRTWYRLSFGLIPPSLPL